MSILNQHFYQERNLKKKYFFSIFIHRIYENGKETVLKYENDVLKSKTVNGVQQALSYN